MITEMREKDSSCQAVLYLIIQITLPTIRIIFTQCAFNFPFKLFPHSVLCLSFYAELFAQLVQWESSGSSVKSLKSLKKWISWIVKVWLAHWKRVAVTEHSLCSSSVRPEEPRRRGFWVHSQSLNTWLIASLAPKPIFEKGQAIHYYCLKERGIQTIIATLRSALRDRTEHWTLNFDRKHTQGQQLSIFQTTHHCHMNSWATTQQQEPVPKCALLFLFLLEFIVQTQLGHQIVPRVPGQRSGTKWDEITSSLQWQAFKCESRVGVPGPTPPTSKVHGEE